jgi:hypothetical protein
MWITILLIGLLTQQPAPKASPKKPTPAQNAPPVQKKPETPAQWLHRVTGIDLQAYRNLTAVRSENRADPAPRLVEFDRSTGMEKTLWACGGCWSPARVNGGTVVLRQTADDPTGAELWLVRDGRATPTRIASVPKVAAIAGTVKERVYVGIAQDRCASSSEGPYGIVAVDLARGTVSDVANAPCFGIVSLASSGRIRGNRYLATTRENDLAGNPRPRQLLVMSPATGPTPTATYFDERLQTPPDRYDAVWVDEQRIVYLARP